MQSALNEKSMELIDAFRPDWSEGSDSSVP